MLSSSRVHYVLLLAILISSSFGSSHAFVDKTAKLGVGVTPGGNGYGHGCAFVDLNNDGILEFYVAMFSGQPNLLFEYQGQSAKYVDVAGAIGCADDLDGRGVAWADYDNDGDQDLFVSNYLGANRLYRNDGAGGFTNVAPVVGMNHSGLNYSAAWGDYDKDGYLDLFVCGRGTKAVAQPNLLYRNDGDGTFTEVAAAAGIDDPDKPALACTWLDYDNDGDIDLYIAYDKGTGNTLYRNNNNGTFTDVTSESLIDSGPQDLVVTAITGERWLPMDGMGIAVADYDDNGYLDMFLVNLPPGLTTYRGSPGGHALLRNNGNGTFSEVGAEAGVRSNGSGWGTAFLDYDNDGDDDLYVVHWFAAMPGGNVLYRNNGNGTFTDVSVAQGVDSSEPGFGLTTGDYNNDGFVDMFVNNQGVPSEFFENVPNGNNWVKIRPVGTASNRDGLGAKVTVTTGSLVQMIDVRSGSSYLGNLSRDVEFGLGSAMTIDELEIRWPSGLVDTWTNVPVNDFYMVTEGATLELLPVLITRFEGKARMAGIELGWAVQSDETIRGYRVYREERGDHNPTDIGGLLAADATGYVDRVVMPGEEYGYTLSVEETDGGKTRSPTVWVTARQLELALGQNHPNPFNPSTRIEYILPEPADVELVVYDVRGASVATLVEGRRPAGLHEAQWYGRDDGGRAVASGVYFLQLRAGKDVLTRKMVLLK